VTADRIDVTPEPTAEEAEAIRRALAALGLVEPAADRGQSPNGPRDASVTDSGDAGPGTVPERSA
jgi:hypothetical protein